MIKSIKDDIYKYIIVILLYLVYQENLVVELIKRFGFNIMKLPKTPRIFCFGVCDLLLIAIIIFMFKDELKKCIKDIKNNFNDRSYLALTCWLTGSVIMTISSIIISKIVKQDVSSNEKVVRDSIKLAPIYMLISCSIVAPIFEEMIFRKSVNVFCKTKKRFIIIFGSLISFALSFFVAFKLKPFYNTIPESIYPAIIFIICSGLGYGFCFLLSKFVNLEILFIITSGILFGLLHIIGTYNSPLDLLYIIPYGAMGASFAYLLAKTDNIMLTMSVHALHNTILVISQIIRLYI